MVKMHHGVLRLEVNSRSSLNERHFHFLATSTLHTEVGKDSHQNVWHESKVIHPKYYKHLKKGAHQSNLGRQKWAGFWQISLYNK